MTTIGAQRPAQRPRRHKLFLPLALASRSDALSAPADMPLSGQELRRIVAGMIG